MRNKVFTVAITATSKKDNGTFRSDRITAYLEPVDENTTKAMEAFGLTRYTGKDGSSFFIVKTSEVIALYTEAHGTSVPLGGTKGAALFRTRKGATVQVNIIEGENKGNKFYRLQAIQDIGGVALEDIEATNPFDD